jgi:hypothetical protein
MRMMSRFDTGGQNDPVGVFRTLVDIERTRAFAVLAGQYVAKFDSG